MIIPGDTITALFTLRTAASVLSDADALPTGSVYRNGTLDGAVTVTITSTGTTGHYKAAATLPATWARGDVVQILINAMVASNTDAEYVFGVVLSESLGLEFTVDTATVTPTTTTFALDSGAPSTDTVMVGGYVVFLTGVNAGMPPQPIATYTGATRSCTFAAANAWPTAP
ncbi:MAG: hypothetical protein JKX85_06165, partial [Phycisphaeraceae bacterium]|nr:hypothetical protein [Phycisphaeraceae bacterium]